LAKIIPTNDKPPFAGGAKARPIDSSRALKNSTDVVLGRSTSENTTPKPETVAGVSVPATKKCTFVTAG
jgi:hypothetical protein